jgi:hypothetical protein
MNEELLAAGALLVQSGPWLVNGHCLYQVCVRFANCNNACVWPAVHLLALATVPYYLNRSLQCTSRSPSYFNNTGSTLKEIMCSILPLKYRQFPRTKAYRRPVSLYCATNIISQLVFAFIGRNRLNLNEKEASDDTLKIQKPPVTLI